MDNIIKSQTIFQQATNDLARIFHNNREFESNDLRVKRKAKTIKEFYHGYDHIIQWPNTPEKWNLFLKDTAYNWCKENCKGAFANHVLDTFGGKIIEYSVLAEEGCFWAFELEEDAVMFSLRW
jgi:hypothetical protein